MSEKTEYITRDDRKEYREQVNHMFITLAIKNVKD